MVDSGARRAWRGSSVDGTDAATRTTIAGRTRDEVRAELTHTDCEMDIDKGDAVVAGIAALVEQTPAPLLLLLAASARSFRFKGSQWRRP